MKPLEGNGQPLLYLDFDGVLSHENVLWHEQGAYLDGHEQPSWREQGTGEQLDALGRALATITTG